MSGASIIFKDLPATFPEKDEYRKPSVISSVVLHGLLIVGVIITPLLIPQTISERDLLINLVAPVGPPPPAAPPPVKAPEAAAIPKVAATVVRPVSGEPLITPTRIPAEISRIVDEPIAAPAGVIGGVAGGVPGGSFAGVLGGVLASNAVVNAPPALAPPPPPPPPPKVAATGPVRTGGMVKEPRLIKMVPPVYPQLASKARVTGTVVLEATLTSQGTVEEIKVISGHPLLVKAAIDSVRQWVYEPTYLNGDPVPVILTARVHFLTTPLS